MIEITTTGTNKIFQNIWLLSTQTRHLNMTLGSGFRKGLNLLETSKHQYAACAPKIRPLAYTPWYALSKLSSALSHETLDRRRVSTATYLLIPVCRSRQIGAGSSGRLVCVLFGIIFPFATLRVLSA